MTGMKNFYRLCLLFVCAFLFSAAPVFAQNYEGATGQRIGEIRIIGTQRIEPATIMTYLDVRTGDSMTDDTLDRALKSLFGTGLFADVKLQQAGNVLEVHVVENPVINEITFEGNQKLDDEELLAEIQLRPRQVFTRSKVQSDASRLYQVYQRSGRFSVNIDPKIIELDQNRVNLVFEITEGAVTRVKSIRFVGNQHYDDDKLRSVISTKEDRWYKVLSADDRYDPDRLSYDQELLRRYYLSQGYADFRVVAANAELSRNRDSFYLTFTVEEGDRYNIGDISISSQLRNFDANQLRGYVTFNTGDWYNADEIQKSIDQMTDALGDMQFAFVSIRPDVQRKREEKIADIAFQISETPRVYVERIDINGNVRTLDKVIRRKILVAEGDPFNKTKLEKSEQNIKDLSYFEDVKLESSQGSAPDKTVVDVTVAEQSTGELSIGAGFSTSDGPLLDTSIRERNLLGKGQDLSVGATLAGKRTEFSVSFTEPYFLDRDFSAGIDAFHTTRDYQEESSFDQKRTGGALRFAYPLSEKWRQGIAYRIENNDITNVKSTASRFVRDQEGNHVTSLIAHTLTYDARDSKLFPTRGLYSWLGTDIAGLGGDAHYFMGKVGSSYFYPVADNWIFNVLGETGLVTSLDGEGVKINERFFLGGQNLRGFSTSGVGPRDRITDDSLGGSYFYRGTAELSFPLGLPKEMGVKGYAFTDAGSLWGLDENSGAGVVDENALRAAAGLGVSWRSPLGPIRMDVAYPYVKEDYDDTQTFSFSFGTRF